MLPAMASRHSHKRSSAHRRSSSSVVLMLAVSTTKSPRLTTHTELALHRYIGRRHSGVWNCVRSRYGFVSSYTPLTCTIPTGARQPKRLRKASPPSPLPRRPPPQSRTPLSTPSPTLATPSPRTCTRNSPPTSRARSSRPPCARSSPLG